MSELNSAQAEAVRCIKGPSLIIAGAGSGKTKVLIFKIAYLLDQGVHPGAILALTFTNKASREMKDRISAMVGRDKSVRLWMGTFHSIFVRFLRDNAHLIGFPSSFTIYDASDTRSAIRQCIKELQLDEKIYKPNDVASRISLAKNNLITCGSYANNSSLIEIDKSSSKGRVHEIYSLYSKKCFAAGVMDFDDILLYMNILLRDHPEVCEALQNQFDYILVDEYQDTNYAQYLIIKKLSYNKRNITVVGDDSQSIYGFRGARIKNILNFRKDYPEAKEFRLEQNYRSTRTIVGAANSLISHNTNRLKKECFSEGEMGEKIEVISSYTETDEGSAVASSIIDRIYADKASYADFAILYRTNAQSRIIEEMLRRKNLPYKIYAGHSFYERAEVKDMLAYFRLVVNHHDDESLRRVINVPARGIGETSMNCLAAAASSHSISLWEAIHLSDLESFGLKQAAVNKMKSFTSLIDSFSSKVPVTDAYAIASEITAVSGVISSLRADNSIESQSRLENVEELLNSVNEYVEERARSEKELGNEEPLITLQSYLENVSLLTDIDSDDSDPEDRNRIKLMTAHSSKGLEFPYVYIVGMEENLFPSLGSMSSQDDVEEERRLFYVALTRARKCAAVSFSKSRMKWGQRVNYPPSRFLKEIDDKYFDTSIETQSHVGSFVDIDTPRTTTHKTIIIPRPTFSKTVHTASANFAPDNASDFQKGQRVEHDRFGYGTILSLEGESVNKKAIVDFEIGGKKTLLLKYAKLMIIH